nr:hypothetical protein [Tanacetum cinerariifolium]
MAKIFLGKYFPPSMVTKLRNEITNFRQRTDESLFEAWERYKLSIDHCPNQNMLPVTQIDTFYNGLTLRHRDTINATAATVGQTQNVYAARAYQGASHGQNPLPAYQASAYQAPGYQALIHQLLIPQPQVVTTNEFTNFMETNDAILKNMQTNMTSLTNSNLELKNMFGQFMKMNTALSLGSRTLPGNTITNSKEDLKERETEVTKDMVPPTNNGSTKDVQPSVVQAETPILNFEPIFAPITEPVAAPVSAPKPNQKPSIPYPSRLYDQKLHDKANDQEEKFFQIFKDLNFNISFADALIMMRKFGPTIKTLLTNKDKLLELARTPLNEHCSAVLLKTLADLDVSINLMPLSGWNKLSLPELSPTCMTLELTDCFISRPVGVVEDVFVKVGTFYFPADFIVINFDADPQVPLILERSFLKKGRALIDVFEGEITLRVGKEAITFNLDQTSRNSATYNDMTANRIDVIDMACEEYSQKVLFFSDVIVSGNPTPYYDPIISTSSLTLTHFGDSEFLLEEVDAFLALEDDATSPKVNQSYFDPEGDILLLEAFLNEDLSLPPPNQGNYLPQVRKELKICEAKNDKSSIDEPPEVKLKDLPPHLEYAFFKGVVLGQCEENHFRPIHYASKTMTNAESNYTTTEKEMLAVVYDFEKFWPYLIMNKSIVYTDHSALKYLFAKKDSKARLLRWVLLLQEFKFKIKSSGGVYTNRKPLTFSRLATMDPPGDIMAQTTLPRSVKERFSNVMKYLKIPSKFAKFLMFGASISWGRSRLHAGTNIYSFGTPGAIISDRGTHFCNDQYAKVMLKYGVTQHLVTAYHP